MIEPNKLSAIAGLVTAVGAVAIYRLNTAQASKVRAELLEKLRRSISANDRMQSCELFRMAFRLRMPFSDIRSLSNEEEFSLIVRILQSNLGAVRYDQGRLQYGKRLQNATFRKVANFVSKFGVFIMAVITGALIIFMAMLEGPISLAMLVFVIPAAAILAAQLWDIRQDRIIERIIEAHASKI